MSIKALQEYTFTAKYAQWIPQKNRRETWNETINRVKNMMIEKYKDKDVSEDIEFAYDMMRKRKVLGSQRALQFGGPDILKHEMKVYNCFSVDTEFVTTSGVKKFSDFNDGDYVKVLTHLGNWKNAVVKKFGRQQLFKVTMTKKDSTKEVFCTADHRWLLSKNLETTKLKVGDKIRKQKSIFQDFNYDEAPPDERLYWCYGFVYGDGTLTTNSKGGHTYSMVRLCGNDAKFEYRFNEMGFKSSTSLSLCGDVMCYTGKYQKNAPNPDIDSPELIRAFVRGYLDADGAKNYNVTGKDFNSIQSSELDHIEFIRRCFPIAGVFLISETDLTGQVTNFGTRPYTISFTTCDYPDTKMGPYYTVKNIEKDKIDEVWCLQVEDDRSFVLPFGIPTGNCCSSYVDRIEFFQECMYLLLCGCGTGFSVQKHHVSQLPKLVIEKVGRSRFTIEDSIEGWSDAIGAIVSSYFEVSPVFSRLCGTNVEFDFTKVRPEGSPIGESGRKAPGPEPLKRAISKIRKVLDSAVSRCNQEGQFSDRKLRPIEAYDVVMHSADAVISGGIRRSACIAIFSPDDEDMAKAKTGSWFTENPQRGRSNNSALLLRDSTTRTDFHNLMKSVKEFGEPGFLWSDSTEMVVNPCFTIDTKILTNNGWEKFSDLVDIKEFDILQDSRVTGYLNEGNESWNVNTSINNGVVINKAYNARLTGENKEVFELKLSCGRVVKATSDHHFATTEGMVQLKDLSSDHDILIPIPEVYSSNKESSDFKLGYLAGLVFGDGCFVEDGKSVRIDLWGNDIKEDILKIEKYVNDLLDEYNIEPYHTKRKNYSFRMNSGESYGSKAKYTLQSASLNSLFNSIGIRSNKENIEFIHGKSKDFKSGFLSGLLYTDGHTEYNNKSKSLSIRLSSINIDILRDCQLVLQELGVHSRIGLMRKAGQKLLPDGAREYKLFNTKDCYRLIIGGFVNCINSLSFLELADKDKNRIEYVKTTITRIVNPKFYSKVKSITFYGNENVYCLSEDNRRTLIANGITARRCCEIGMHPVTEDGISGWQACNLSTINCSKVRSEGDFYEACKAAAIIGTLQAGFTNVKYLTDASRKILEREALLGVSGTGWMESPDICLNPEIQREGARIVVETNERVAKLIGINAAARATTVKPEGCLIKDTIVQTSDGILSLEEVGDIYGDEWQEIDLNIVTDNIIQKANKFYINGKKLTKKILTSSGIELESTYNHKFKVVRDSSLVWSTADSLSVGDKIPYRIGGYNGGSVQELEVPILESSRYATRTKKLTIESVQVDDDFAWFLGLYTGDGSNHPGKFTIRIHGDYRRQEHLLKAKEFLFNRFGLETYVYKYNNDESDNRCALYISSREFYKLLEYNGLLKNKSLDINIPLIIRKSQTSIINSFINGYGDADGCVKSRDRSFCTISKTMAIQLVQCLRAVGIDCKMRLMPPTESSYGSSMRYWVQERAGRSSDNNNSKYNKDFKLLDSLSLSNYGMDEIVDISDGFADTYDIAVDHDDHTYIANSYISHNTSSTMLGTSSGIHPHHAKRYIRHVQANKQEEVYQFFKKINPRACEHSVWSANDSDEVISFCIEVPPGSKTKNQVNAISLLNFVKSTQQNWVMPGKVEERCTQKWLTHNVSNTINVKPDEWDEVEDYIYENREWFCGISLLPVTGDKDYPQAPFTQIFLPSEMLTYYGEGVMFVSGLIEISLQLYDDNLWAACDALLGVGATIRGSAKETWRDRCIKFADKYFASDLKRLTYAMKDVYNYKLWTELNMEYKDVDYTQLIEEENNTLGTQELSCANGLCEI